MKSKMKTDLQLRTSYFAKKLFQSVRQIFDDIRQNGRERLPTENADNKRLRWKEGEAADNFRQPRTSPAQSYWDVCQTSLLSVPKI